MRRVPLTDLAIQKLKPPTNGQLEVFDSKAPGLSIRVGTTGTKTFFLSYRIKGERKRLRGKLGRYGEMSLSGAREERIAKLAQAAKGIDPFAVAGKSRIDASITAFDACVKRFIDQYILPNSKSPENPIRILRKEFVAAWGTRDVRTITKADVLRVLRATHDRGAPVAANRALARVRKLFNWLIDQDEHELLENSPCAGVKLLFKERSRERVLTHGELGRLWLAADRLGYPYGAFFMLLALLGQRRSEIASMRWADIDCLAADGEALWRIPSRNTKNSEPQVVPLPRLAVAILRGCPRVLGSQFVFPSARHKEKHLTGFSKWKEKLDDLAELSDWTPHDLRRTQASVLPSLGVSEVVLEHIHNHKLSRAQVSDSARVYNRYRYVSEMREALEKYAAHIENLMNAGRVSAVA
jgi:integrase